MTLRTHVADDVRALAPGFAHVTVVARGLVGGPSDAAGAALLDDAARRLAARLGDTPPQQDPHMQAWRAAYAAFGAKPSKFRNSAEALARRALADAGLPRINRLVDIYNAVSVAHLVPVGGEDTDQTDGDMHLIRATGEERFDEEHPDAGEVVWRDGAGVTCRRWNWRQGVRTRLTEDSTNALFLLERQEPMTYEELTAAAEELAEALQKSSPGAEIEIRDPA
ncbi:B3/4 domain-containing protein [Streptomyces sp. NPDC004134]|uniref:B3/B4 domain-containing protein n=1 Tax=Streptomyces sp. NPDC004134 TaxID=3364691 RepID=UPI0036A753E8